MKISLSWLKEHMPTETDPAAIAEVLTGIGLEVEEYHELESVKGSLRGLVVGRVVQCEQHPNADRLKLTMVDIGTDHLLQIVCGAPNVSTGQIVIVAPVGTTLYDAEGKPWKIKAGKIRGSRSEGMICAEDEVGLGVNHDGIMLLPNDWVVGRAVSDYIDTSTDVVFEIGLTPNRSDATSHRGVARDLWAAMHINHGHQGELRQPDVSSWRPDDTSALVKVEVYDYEACPRYCGVVIEGVSVGQSPPWLQDRLRSIGVRPINNIVDITNYVLHDLGQPLHAFDLDKIGGATVRVRTLPAGTAFLSLDGVTRVLDGTDLMICDGNDQGMCIAGIFGGLSSGVTADTKRIFLEAAHFNAKSIRRTSTRHLLYTDASKIFEKGSDPNICELALKKASLMIRELAGGRITSNVIDLYPQPVLPIEVRVRYSYLTRLAGFSVNPEQIKQIITALGMTWRDDGNDHLIVLVPTDKVDVLREADVAEEILRIYGFDRIPVRDRMTMQVTRRDRVDPVSLRNLAASYLVAQGFLEMMGLSMVDRRYADLHDFGTDKDAWLHINNTSNAMIDLMRPNMVISALEAVRYNQGRQQHQLRMFEFGKTYFQLSGGAHREEEHLTITLSGWSQESWLIQRLEAEREFFVLKSLVQQMLRQLGVTSQEVVMSSGGSFDYGLKLQAEGHDIVQLGRLDDQLLGSFDVRGPVFYADMRWEMIVALGGHRAARFQPISRFPSVRRDLALVVDKSVSYQQIYAAVQSELGPFLAHCRLFDVYEGPQLGDGTKKSYALALQLSDPSKTFSDAEIDHMIDRLLNRLLREVAAKLR